MGKKGKEKKRKGKKLGNDQIATSSYVCSNCGATEEIPDDVLEYFDKINPAQLIFGGHQFKCENCSSGIMSPINKESPMIVRVGLFGSFEGF